MNESPNTTAHRARKRFGQNFLHDAGIIRRIVDAVNPQPGQHLLEIGPGQGAITAPLLASGAKLDAVELDRDLAAWLQQRFASAQNFSLHQSDILKFDLGSLTQQAGSLRVVGNLPYNISTPCLFHLLRYRHLIDDMLFMLQREVVTRMAAAPGSADYGRLSIMLQYHCEVESLFEVPPGAFKPAPKVTSAIVRLRPHRQLPVTAGNPALFERVVREAFSQRRKTLKNGLKGLIKETGLQQLPVDASQRPDQLSIHDYVAISDALAAAGEPGQVQEESHHAEV